MAFPPIFTDSWDITTPPDTQQANLLGQDLRNLKLDVMQRLSLLSGTTANMPTPETVNATWGGAGFGLIFFATDTGIMWQWNGAAWVNITANFFVPPAQTPQIVASINLLAQQGNIGGTTLYTPTANGFYRFTPSVVVTQAATTSGSPALPGLSWIDADTSVNLSGFFLTTPPGPTNTVGDVCVLGGSPLPPLALYAKAGQPIQYFAGGYLSSGATPLQYSFRARLEFLGT